MIKIKPYPYMSRHERLHLLRHVAHPHLLVVEDEAEAHAELVVAVHDAVVGVRPQRDHDVEHRQRRPPPRAAAVLRLQRHGVAHKPHVVHLQLELGAAEVPRHGEQVGERLVGEAVQLALLDVGLLHVLPLVEQILGDGQLVGVAAAAGAGQRLVVRVSVIIVGVLEQQLAAVRPALNEDEAQRVHAAVIVHTSETILR